MTKRERMILALAALGGDEGWIRREDAVSAAHMEKSACEAVLQAMTEAGQVESGSGMVKLATWYPG